MTRIDAPNTAGEVEKAVPIYVLKPCILRASNVQRRRMRKPARHSSVTAVRESA